jgi:hypothetical protein
MAVCSIVNRRGRVGAVGYKRQSSAEEAPAGRRVILLGDANENVCVVALLVLGIGAGRIRTRKTRQNDAAKEKYLEEKWAPFSVCVRDATELRQQLREHDAS